MQHFLLAISDLVGITGVTFILLGYFFISTGYLTSKQLIYPLLNFTGAILILFSLYFHWNLSSVVIEVAWMMISIMGILRIVTRRRAQM